ncbi:MAG: ABC transporter ATP-binding protein [Xanthobacteraceae bacterium]|nr:ABC transporter ATP-binding protein [Xanthobacteraceae bacterium]
MNIETSASEAVQPPAGARDAEGSLTISARGVSKRYHSVMALHPLDLDIRRGEVFCLLGPNGSGKSSFIRMLAGYLTPSSGSISVCGHDVVTDGLAARRLIGYVPERVPLYNFMRVGEFLRFAGRLRGVEEQHVGREVARVVDLLALGDVVGKPIRTLSRGYRQRTALAQALVHDPEILILDEPTNGLDPRQIMETRALIRTLAGRCTVLMTSHILSEVEKTAHRVGLLLHGKLLGVRAIAETPNLEAWFLSVT